MSIRIRRKDHDVYVRKLTPEDRLKIIELFDMNYSIISIARYFNVDRSTVYYYLRNIGITFSKTHKNYYRKDLFSKEEPQKEIKKKTKVNMNKVQNYRKKFGHKIRPKTYKDYLKEQEEREKKYSGVVQW